jgi:hypothetical protein
VSLAFLAKPHAETSTLRRTRRQFAVRRFGTMSTNDLANSVGVSIDALVKLFDDLRSDLSNVVPPSNAEKAVEILRSYLEKHAAIQSIDQEVVLETFDGFVDRIEGETAFVTLQSRANGDVEEGTYPASELAKMGIHEQSCFVFKTVNLGNAIRPVFEPVPQKPLADEVLREIDSKIDQVLPHEDPGIPY